MPTPLVFISSGAASKRLDTARHTFQHLFVHVPHLYVSKTGGHLFPLSYIEAFATYLARARQRPTMGAAAEFWKTQEAYQLYRLAASQLAEGLSLPALTLGDLAELLGIPYSTIRGWSKSGVLTPQRMRLRPKEREIMIVPCDDIKRALKWQVPLAPPGLPPMFISANEVNERARQQGRDFQRPTGAFGQLITPGGGSAFPALYVAALLDNTTGPVTRALAIAFNTTHAAREAMLKARAEFHSRLSERQQTSPFSDGLLMLVDVAWLFARSTKIVQHWCEGGHLPYVAKSDDKLIRPAALLARCKWVLPGRG